jgi:2-polyprenyl-3-methyl-5-hydroxy-6-metoxy-1,4-benzoquinol methylase
MNPATPENHQQLLRETRAAWDQAASTFDNEPDHGLRDPAVRDAWKTLLASWLPPAPVAILDVGCGTGSLSMLLAGLGYRLTGIDLSPAMIALAQAKAARHAAAVQFEVMDAAYPQLPPAAFEVVLCRHLLWALPEPRQVLQRWTGLLKPTGRLCLVEGFWHTRSGLHAGEIVAMLPPAFMQITTQNLSGSPELWGGQVADERFAVLALLNS